MRRRALDQIGCDVGHDMQADRQLLQLAGNLRGAAVRRLRQRDHDLVDTAGATGVDQIREPAAERQSLRLQSIGTGAIVVHAGEADSELRIGEEIVDASCDRSRPEHRYPRIEAPGRSQHCEHHARGHAPPQDEREARRQPDREPNPGVRRARRERHADAVHRRECQSERAQQPRRLDREAVHPRGVVKPPIAQAADCNDRRDDAGLDDL